LRNVWNGIIYSSPQVNCAVKIWLCNWHTCKVSSTLPHL